MTMTVTDPGVVAPDTSAPAADESYFAGYDDETKGWLNNRGMDKLSANDALAAAIKGHRNAEASLGVPQDRRIDLPVDQTAEGAMDAVYNRLGRPETPDAYTFEGAATDGPDKAFDEWAKEAFHKTGLSAGNANALHASFKEFINGTVNQSEADRAIQTEADLMALKQEWGPTFEKNTNLALATANKFMSPEDFAALKGGMGNNAAMKMLQKIGAGFGEDTFVSDDSLPDGHVTPEGAREEIKALKRDKGFIALLEAKDVNARKKWDALHRVGFGS
jgi:hypothetical protein